MAKHRRSHWGTKTKGPLTCHGRSPFTDGRRPIGLNPIISRGLIINLSRIIRLYTTYKNGERFLNF